MAPPEMVGWQRQRQREIKRRDAARIRNAQASVDCAAPRRPPCAGSNPKRTMLQMEKRRKIDMANRKMIEMILRQGQTKLVPDDTDATVSVRSQFMAKGVVARAKTGALIDAGNKLIRQRLLGVGPSLNRKQWEEDMTRHRRIAAHMSRYSHLPHPCVDQQQQQQQQQQAEAWQSGAGAGLAPPAYAYSGWQQHAHSAMDQ